MSRTKRTHGYDRKSLVPVLPGTNVKACSKCDKWFAAGSRQRVCDGCLPRSALSRRHTGNSAYLTPRSSKPAGQRGVKNRVSGEVKTIFSEYLGLTFTCKKSDPRYSRLETIVLAHELAARELWESKGASKGDVTPQNVSAAPYRLNEGQADWVTRRNVELGVQGK